MPDPSNTWKPDVGTLRAKLLDSLPMDWQGGELPVPETPVPCHVGVSTEGWSWIRIECDPRTVEIDDDSSAVSIKVTADGYRVGVAPTAEPTVTTHFLDGVVGLVKAGHEPGDAGRAALQNWRDLLARAAGARLSDNALVGLFGELEVLETVLRCGGDFESWTGWNKDHNDFRLPGLVIEVKSTLSANYRRVRIHGLQQLDDPQDGSDLVLVLRRLEPSPDGRSVPDVIRSLINMGVPTAPLLDRLSQVNYWETHKGTYEQFRYVSQEVALRQVDSDHPRLVQSMLTDVQLSSIDRIDYELNLNGDADKDMTITLEELISDHLETR